jgi:hypothetical protein
MGNMSSKIKLIGAFDPLTKAALERYVGALYFHGKSRQSDPVSACNDFIFA